MRPRLRELDYAPQATELLMNGLPIVYSEGGLVIEYPDGHRVRVRRHKRYDEQGAFQRYTYEVTEPQPSAPR